MAGSATAGARGGGARCLAATLAATDEGPGFPFSMANGERGSEDEEKKGWRSAGSRLPLLLFIKEQGGGSTAPLSQSRRRKARRLGPTCCPDPRRPGFLPPPSATPVAWKPHGWHAGPRRRMRRPLPTP